MNLLESISKEIILGGHLLALGTSSIAASAAIMAGKQPTLLLLVMAYLFSYGAYMLNRSSEMDQDVLSHPTRTQHLSGRRKYFPIVIGFCFVLGYALAVMSNLILFVALIVPLILAFAYSIGSKRLVGVLGAKKLKEKLVAKNLIISFGWSLIPLLVGLYYLSLPLSLLLLSPFIFLRLMVNTILFDIRDVKSDTTFGTRTVPTQYGVARAFDLIGMIDLLSAAYLALVIWLGLLPLYSALMFVFPVYSSFYRWLAKKSDSRLNVICDLFADGEYLLWGPVVLIGQFLI